MVTAPVLPVFAVLAEMLDSPSIESAPATSTRTLPPAPDPKVAEEISLLLASDRPPAVTTTVPAFPAPKVLLEITP
jgi:hypothetical protein